MTQEEKEFCIRAIEFLNVAAGEGIWFKDMESYPDELDAGTIMYDFWESCNREFPDWVPLEIKETYA